MAKLRRSVSRPSPKKARAAAPAARSKARPAVKKPAPKTSGRPSPKPAAAKTPARAKKPASARPVPRAVPPAPAGPLPKARPKAPAPPPRRSTYADAVVLYERGLHALQAKRYRESAETLRRVIAEFPEEIELHERAQLYIRVCERRPVQAAGTGHETAFGIQTPRVPRAPEEQEHGEASA